MKILSNQFECQLGDNRNNFDPGRTDSDISFNPTLTVKEVKLRWLTLLRLLLKII